LVARARHNRLRIPHPTSTDYLTLRLPTANRQPLSQPLSANRHSRTPSMLEFKTSKGTFTVQLFEKQAPITVENFYRYADEGFFDGTIFHRVIPGFMIQGGGLTEDLRNKKGHPPIKNEAANG